MSNDEIYLFYVGKGVGTLFGVPARNLTRDEAQIHGAGRLVSSGLYKYADRAKVESKPAKRSRAQRAETKESDQ